MNLSDVFVPESSTLENAKVLAALMRALTEADVAYLEHHKVPKLYASRVVYARTNEWERIPDVLARGWGDCKSLSAWLVAEYRMQGVWAVPVFRWKRRPNGVSDYHILVQTRKGYEDPSKVLGMGGSEWDHFGNGAMRR
jgi:hypothetical protein